MLAPASPLGSAPGGDDWSRVAPVAAGLGIERALTSQYYEVRLATSSNQVDYLAAFHRGRAALLRHVVKTRVAEEPSYQVPGWRAVERLLDDWLAGTSLASRRTAIVWLEFDDHERGSASAVPCVSVCVTPSYRTNARQAGRSDEDLAHAREVLGTLDAPEERLQGLDLVFEQLPADARWIHVSYMLGRRVQAVKLYGTLRRNDIPPYLERIGWAGDSDAVIDMLRRYYPAELLGQEAYVDLNLDDYRDPARATLGLAVSQQHLLRGPDNDPKRERMLRLWESFGLCDPLKSRAVSAWPASAGAPTDPFVRDQRYLDLKLVWRTRGDIQVKAYLGRAIRRGIF